MNIHKIMYTPHQHFQRAIDKAVADLRKKGPIKVKSPAVSLDVRNFKSFQSYLDKLLKLRRKIIAKGYTEVEWDMSEGIPKTSGGVTLFGLRPETREEFEKRIKDNKDWIIRQRLEHKALMDIAIKRHEDFKVTQAIEYLAGKGFKVTKET